MSEEQDLDLLFYRSALKSSLIWAMALVFVVLLIVILC